jgi:hypothetical protein
MVLEHHLAEPAGELNPALCEECPGELLVLPLKMTFERALRAETTLALPVLVMKKISLNTFISTLYIYIYISFLQIASP